MPVEEEVKPALVLDDTCLNQRDVSTALMGKVKEFGSLSNLKMVLANEGFDNIKLKYMGGLWVMIEFLSDASKENFKANVASTSLHIDERVTWVDIEGMPLKAWTLNTFKRIVSKWGELLHVEDQEEDCFYTKRICFKTKLVENIFESFKIIIQGKVFWIRAKEVSGWAPDFTEDNESEDGTDDEKEDEDFHEENVEMHKFTTVEGESDIEEVSETIFNNAQFVSINNDDPNSGIKDTKLEDPFNIYSLLQGDVRVNFIQDETVTSGVKNKNLSNNSKEDMEGSTCSGLAQKAKKDWVKELYIKNKVNFLSLQETKMEIIELFNIKMCWGNFIFDYVVSPSVGNSGGILCIWDPSMFRKLNSTIADYFVMIRGEWIPNGKSILIISIYAPQDVTEKKMLWDCLLLVISNWQEGFDNLVETTWNEAQVVDTNAMGKLMKKLKHLKEKIREWIKTKRANSKNYKSSLKKDLAEIDGLIDKGEGNIDVLSKRLNILNLLHDLDKLESMEAAQKAKIKWAIEGDENSKYYHGILNKKRNQSTIRGILVDGIWTVV
ncbi:RNA-directed DNA polymerase, eukaryota [Tanacetum coccineum]